MYVYILHILHVCVYTTNNTCMCTSYIYYMYVYTLHKHRVVQPARSVTNS